MTSKISVGLLLVNFIGMSVLIFLHFNHGEKVGYIDSSRVINSYHGMAEARKAYQAKVAIWKANIDTLTAEVQEDISKYQTEKAGMTTKENELTRKLIQTKQQQLAEYQRAINDKAGQEDAAATKKVIDEINAYIKAYGEAHNYTLVLAATEYGNIAYAESYLDITERIIEGLNNKYGAENMK